MTGAGPSLDSEQFKNRPSSLVEKGPPQPATGSLNILITNVEMKNLSGTTLFVRDLALELLRQGHRPVVYSPQLGQACQSLLSQGIVVSDTLRIPGFRPDVIHGHHMLETARALARHPGTPAVYFCHDHLAPHDHTPIHPGIMRYFGVSRLCLERLQREQAPPDKIRQFHNFVDTNRFRPRPTLPDRPGRALVFSNYATLETHVPAVAEACKTVGLELEIVGQSWGQPTDRPEEVLGRYDLIFAKGKAALEAMAVGAAVILCDFGGVGPMVTTERFDRLRDLNFGFQALVEPLEPEAVLKQISQYDAPNARQVRDLVRSQCNLEQAVAALVCVYREIMDEHQAIPGQAHLNAKARFHMPYRKYLMTVFIKMLSNNLPRYVPRPVRPWLRTTPIFKIYNSLSRFLEKHIR
jgi:hypothetical protein